MRRALGLLAASVLASGCVATQRDMLELSSQTEDLKAQVLELKGTISSLQSNQAELAVGVKELRQELGVFTETIKESQNQMAQLSSKLDDMGASVANKVASIGETLTTQQAKTMAEQKAALAEQKAALSRQSPTDLFHAAEVRLAKKDYELAAKGFEQYLEQFPKGALIDVAVYSLGESYFGLKKWEDAGRQFGLFLERYPKSKNTASARLLYALCLINLKRNLDEAAQYLESVSADFPASAEAKAAAKHLKKLETLPTPKKKT